MGLFSKIKEGLKKTKEALSYKLNKVFTGGVLTDDFYDELEYALITSDMGAQATEELMDELRDVIDEKHLRDTGSVRTELKRLMTEMLERFERPEYEYPLIITVVGVNGVGKTTAIGKLAKKFKAAGKDVVIAAADTFRAAAADQLTVWAERAGVRIIKHAEGADPGAVVYDAVMSFNARGNDVLLIDTAGRLHNKKNLMDELGKIARHRRPRGAGRDETQLHRTRRHHRAERRLTGRSVRRGGGYRRDHSHQAGRDGQGRRGAGHRLRAGSARRVRRRGEGIDDLEDFSAADFVEGIVGENA